MGRIRDVPRLDYQRRRSTRTGRSVLGLRRQRVLHRAIRDPPQPLDGQHEPQGGRGVPGGSAGVIPDEIKAAASIAFSGQDPVRYLEETDSEKRVQMEAIAAEYVKLVQLLNEDLAHMVISKLAEAMKGPPGAQP